MPEKRQIVLVVDDTPENIEVLRQLLRTDYTIHAAISGEKGLEIARKAPQPDIILLDILMPGIDGYEVCRQLKNDPLTAHIPVVFISALDQVGHETLGLELGAVDYIRKPFEPVLVKARVRNHLVLKRYEKQLEALVRARTAELALTQQITIEALANLAEFRDNETGGHIKRTQNYVRALTQHLSTQGPYQHLLDPVSIDMLYRCAPLHDIGKVAIRDVVLLKPGRLTPEEFEEMKQHVIYGAKALEVAEGSQGESLFLQFARQIILGHHERWDGKGYPQGLRGTETPLPGRIMAVADVYDALISHRIYKPAYSHTQAVEIIVEGSGSHFDPVVVDAFIALGDEFRTIALTHADEGMETWI